MTPPPVCQPKAGGTTQDRYAKPLNFPVCLRQTQTGGGVIRGLLLTCLIGMGLGATSPCVSASALCRSDSQTACCHSHAATGTGCNTGCFDQHTAGADSGVVLLRDPAISSFPVADAAWFADTAASLHRAATRQIAFSRGVSDAPSSRRYLFACTFRL